MTRKFLAAFTATLIGGSMLYFYGIGPLRAAKAERTRIAFEEQDAWTRPTYFCHAADLDTMRLTPPGTFNLDIKDLHKADYDGDGDQDVLYRDGMQLRYIENRVEECGLEQSIDSTNMESR